MTNGHACIWAGQACHCFASCQGSALLLCLLVHTMYVVAGRTVLESGLPTRRDEPLSGGPAQGSVSAALPQIPELHSPTVQNNASPTADANGRGLSAR